MMNQYAITKSISKQLTESFLMMQSLLIRNAHNAYKNINNSRTGYGQQSLINSKGHLDNNDLE